MTAIHLVNAADAAYVPHTAAMLHSVFTANHGETFAVHFLHGERMPPEPVQRLRELCTRHGAGFEATPVPDSALAGLPIEGRFPPEAWYRVLLPQLLPRLDRVLWLDSDVIVLRPVGELWEWDLQGRPLAACPNASLYSTAGTVRNLGIADRSQYFNTGVLVLDLKRMREENSEDTLRAAATRYRPWIRFADQDVLNVAYHARYRRLPLPWNVLTHTYFNVPESIRVHGYEEFDNAMRAPRIVHFTGVAAMKPWSYRCGNPYRGDYLRHRALAGWPPPDFPDRSFRNAILRRLPLRLRAVLSALAGRKFGEMLSYLRAW